MMKYAKPTLVFLIAIFFFGSQLIAQTVKTKLPAYNAPDAQLHATIALMDSLFFDAYNLSKKAVIDSMISEDLEFYHDRGGLSTSKNEILTALEKNIFGKVTRHLIEGTLEVYPIPNFGAIEMGWHQFYNKAEPNAKPHPSRFVQIWKQENNKWKLVRVVSLH